MNDQANTTVSEIARAIMIEVQGLDYGRTDPETGRFTCSGAQIDLLEAACNKAAERVTALLPYRADVTEVPKSVSDEELLEWADKRADDAGRVARELVRYRRIALNPPMGR